MDIFENDEIFINTGMKFAEIIIDSLKNFIKNAIDMSKS